MATKLKTNKAMRLGSVMLVLALLTTCAISGTFAKYTTESSGSDTARVAKWGIGTSSISLDNLFSATYQNVQSSTSKDVIAPGTSGEATFEFVANGTAPEVAYKLTVTADDSTCDTSISGNTNIQWKLDNGEWGTWSTLLTNIKKLSGSSTGTNTYSAGTMPTDLSGEHTVYWQWVYYTTDTQDGTDTTMGNNAAAATSEASIDDVTLNIKVNATQVD